MTPLSLPALRSYAELTKPRILLLVIVSGMPPLLAAEGGVLSLAFAAATLAGIALAAGAANALNCYLERDRDALMRRTRLRPLPAARIGASGALVFGIALGLLGTAVLALVGGSLAAVLGVASILFYVFVYTLWLKPRSSWNAVVGGAAGAAAPLIADAAVQGHVGPLGWLLFGIVFFWQPPHVWAIALYRKSDYERAGIPMLPSVIGDEATRRIMLACGVALLPVTAVPVALGLFGAVYAAGALALGAWFLAELVRLLRQRSHAAARRVFHASLGYLFGLFAAMFLDLALR